MMIDVVGWRLIERRQLSCVFLSLLLFLTRSCFVDAVGWGINVMCTVRRTRSCSVDGVGLGGWGWGGVLTSCAQCVERALT